MVATTGSLSSREGQRTRHKLTLRKLGQALQNCSQVATNEPPRHSTEEERFEAWLWGARNEWSIRQHTRGGLFGTIGKAEADRLLKRHIAELEARQ